MDLRAEIWEYTPRTDAGGASTAPPPTSATRGRRAGSWPATSRFRGMVVQRDGEGRRRAVRRRRDRRRVHPGAQAPPPAAHPLAPPTAGTSAPRPPATWSSAMPYGDLPADRLPHHAVWHGRMYVTAIPGLTGDGAIFEVTRPWSPRRARVPADHPAVHGRVRDGGLPRRASTPARATARTGYGVYRIDRRGARYRFAPIVTGGAGRGQIATSVVSMHVFKGRLYVGSSGWYNEEGDPGLGAHPDRPRAGDWQVVAGPPRTVDGAQSSRARQRARRRLQQHLRRPLLADGDLPRRARGGHERLGVPRRVRAYPGLAPWAVDLIEVAAHARPRLRPLGSCDGATGARSRATPSAPTATTSARATS